MEAFFCQVEVICSSAKRPENPSGGRRSEEEECPDARAREPGNEEDLPHQLC